MGAGSGTPAGCGIHERLGSSHDHPLAEPASLGLVKFDSEVIHLAVRGDSLEVTGLYLLCRRREGEPRSPESASVELAPAGHDRVEPEAVGLETVSPAPVELFYPFPADPRMGGIRPGDVESRVPGGDWEPVGYTPLPHGAGLRCRLVWPAADSLEVRTTYRQALTESYARYVVTTTRAWGEPLRWARFEIHLPGDAELSSASYPFARDESAGDDDGTERCYLFETTDFWPERDITFEWTRSP
ncbi:MAG: hypothetical protein KAY32_07335 [Candidatus Eisenbacteria sp.]|nr:hypothetical protein [Candidatus Eisenbacteria bacterium]